MSNICKINFYYLLLIMIVKRMMEVFAWPGCIDRIVGFHFHNSECATVFLINSLIYLFISFINMVFKSIYKSILISFAVSQNTFRNIDTCIDINDC